MDFSADPTSNSTPSDLATLELELQTAAAVHECAVLVHPTSTGEACIAYIVPAGPFSADAAARKLKAGGVGRLPDSYVSVTRLPRDAAGHIDRRALAQLPLLEPESLDALEAALRGREGVDQVVLYADDSAPRVDALHLDAVPGAALASRVQREHTAAGSFAAEASEPVESAPAEVVPGDLPLAVCHGKPLDRGPNPPRTLPDTLLRAAERLEGEYLHFLDSSGAVRDLSFAALLAEARSVAAGLSVRGIPAGSKVLLQLTEPAHIVPAFWACVLGGWVPAISAVPTSYADETSELDRLKHVWRLLDGPPFITSRALSSGVRHLAIALGAEAERVLTIEDLSAGPAEFVSPELNPNDPAFLVMTSGSTGMPKVIMLSHENILTRSGGTNELCRHEPSDRILNWLPFDHIGSISDWHLRCVDLGCHMFYCAKEYVLGEPLNWLRVMDRFRITHSWAPNFAYALLNAALSSSDEAFELSSVKALLTAGEAVSSSTVHDFLERLAAHGLAKTAMRPAFGMAELGSGVTYFQPTPAEPVRLETVDRRTLDAALRRIGKEHPQALSFPSLGPIIPGASMRVVDEQNQPVHEMVIGRLQIAGGPVCLGYFKNPEANAEVFVGDGWFNTGDRAFISQGELFLSGRDKETLIINGANFHNSEIEAAVEQVKGVRVSFTAACAVRPPGESNEKLALFVSLIPCDHQQRAAVLREVQKSVAQRTGTKADYLIPVETTEIPKTAIGKIQRKQLVKRFEAGEFGRAIGEADVLLENERTLPDWFLGVAWQPLALPGSSRGAPARVLVIGEGAGLGRALASLLPGSTMVQDAREFADALGGAAEFDAFVDLTTYGPQAASSANGSHSGAASVLGAACLALAARVQRSAEYGRARASAPRYLMVASASQVVPWSDELEPVRASLPAALRALDQELSTVECGHVDLPFHPAGLESQAQLLLRELGARALEPEVAYDLALIRRVVGFERVTWTAAHEVEARSPRSTRLEPGGLYLVSGGLGGVGTELSSTLLTHFGAKVLIVGRTPLGGAATPEGDARLAQLKKLEALGTVIYHAADVSDENALELAVARVEAELGQALRGAFHLAGVYRERPLVSESHEALSQALAPKVDGTRALHEVTARRAPAFVVSFSSLASIFSGSGLGSYAAANRYQDAFAALARRQHQRASFSLNWSVWKGLGIGAESAPADVLRSRGYLPVPGRSGMQSLFAALEREPGQLLIGVDPASPALRRLTNEPARPLQRARAAVSLKQLSDPAQKLRELRDVRIRDRFGHAISAEPWWLHRFQLDAAGAIDREATYNEIRGADAVIQPLSTELEKRLGAIWKDVLGLDAVGANQSFFDLGGTSLLSVRLFSRIEKEFGVAFEPALLFKAATVGAMAKVLAEAAGPVSQSLHSASSGTPLFLVDDGAGDATRYRALSARLRPAHDLVVLRPFGKDRIPTLHTHVDDMLEHYRAKLRERSATGPYALAGRGVGAALALELACKLQASGESVPFLALIDPEFPDASFDIADVFGLKQVLRAGAELRGGVQQARAALARGVSNLAKEAFDRGRFQLLRYYTDRQQEPPWFVEHLPLATVYGYAAGRRTPARFNGRIHVIRTPLATELARSQARDWGRQATSGVAMHELGTLFSNDPNAEAVELLSKEVSASLEQPAAR